MNSIYNTRIKFDITITNEIAKLLKSQFTFHISTSEIKYLYGVCTNNTGQIFRGSHSLESFNYYSNLPIIPLSEYLTTLKGQTNGFHPIITKPNNNS